MVICETIIIISLLFTKKVNDTPVILRDRKPFTVAWSNVDVNGTEVVIFLVPWSSGTRHFHVQLNSIHSKYVMPYMAQHVTS